MRLREALARDAARSRRWQAAKFGYAPLTWFLDPGFVCVLLFRLSAAAWARGWRHAARLLMQANAVLTGADMQPHCEIGPGLLVPSPCGVNVSGRAGRNLTIMALGGIGGSVRDRDVGGGVGLPVLGDDVLAGPFCGIQGSIRMGDGSAAGYAAGVGIDVAAGVWMAVRTEPVEGAVPVPRQRHDVVAPCGHGSWRRTWADYAADIEAWRAEVARHAGARPPWLSARLANPLLALWAHRMAHFLWCRGWRGPARALAGLNVLVFKLTLPAWSCLGGGVLMPHLAATVFAGRAGARLTIFASAVCAGEAPDRAPVLGQGVMVAGHAGAFGAVTVGDAAVIAPKCDVEMDVPAGAQVWSPSAFGAPRAWPEAVAVPEEPERVDESWRATRARMRRDRARWKAGAAGFPGAVCVRLFRLSHWAFARGWLRVARWLWLANTALTGADLDPACVIGGGLVIRHPAGVALRLRAGEDLTVGTMGGAGSAPVEGAPAPLGATPRLGARVTIGAHAGVYGAVTVGDDVTLRPGCTATRPVAAEITLGPRASRIIRGRPK